MSIGIFRSNKLLAFLPIFIDRIYTESICITSDSIELIATSSEDNAIVIYPVKTIYILAPKLCNPDTRTRGIIPTLTIFVLVPYVYDSNISSRNITEMNFALIILLPKRSVLATTHGLTVYIVRSQCSQVLTIR